MTWQKRKPGLTRERPLGSTDSLIIHEGTGYRHLPDYHAGPFCPELPWSRPRRMLLRCHQHFISRCEIEAVGDRVRLAAPRVMAISSASAPSSRATAGRKVSAT